MAGAVGFPSARGLFRTYPVAAWATVGVAAYLYKAFSISAYQRARFDKDNRERSEELARATK